MDRFEADFAELLPKDSGRDFRIDFENLLPKDSGRDFSADFADLKAAPSAALPAVQADVRKAEPSAGGPGAPRFATVSRLDANREVTPPAAAPIPAGSQAQVRRVDNSIASQQAAEAPVSDAEIAASGTPARMIVSRGGQPRLEGQPDLSPPPEGPQGVRGEVLAKLPASLVTGARTAVAGVNLAIKNQVASILSTNVKTGRNVLGDPIEQVHEKAALALAEKAGKEAQQWAAETQREARLITPKDMNTAEQAVWSFVQSAPPTALGLAVGILTRNPALAMTIAGGGGSAMQFGQTYLEATAKGASHDVAGRAATIDGIIEGLDALPLGVALKPGSKFLTRLASTMGAEGGTEGAQQVGQDLNAYLSWNPDITLGEAWQNLKVAALAGTIGGAIYGAAGHAIEPSPKQQAAAELRALANQIEATDVTQGTQQIAVGLFNPDRAQMREVPKTVAAPQPVEISTPSAAQQQEATPATPAQAEPPAEPVAAAPSEPVQAAPSAAPAAEVVAEPQAEPVVASEVVAAPEEPTEAFPTKEAAQMAARLQASEFKLPFKAVPHPTKEGAWAVEQVVRSEPQQAADRRTAARARSNLKPDESRDTITTFIAKMGGLRLDQAPDITGEHDPVRAPNHPMIFLIRRKGGMGVDAMGEYLVEAGYFAERPDEEQIREAIRAELDGQNQYSFHGAEAQAEAENRKREVQSEAVAFAEEAGVPEIEQVSSPEDLAGIQAFVPAAESELTGPRLALAELWSKASELNEGAAERLAIESDGWSAEQLAAKLQEIINGAEQNVESGNRGVGEAVQPLALTGETEAERQARESGERDRASRDAQEADARDARARADRERGDFGLTGSERAADANPNQDSMFAAGWDVAHTTNEEELRTWTEITNAVSAIAKKITPTVDVRTVLGVWAPDFFPAVGRYYGPRNLIEVALTATSPERVFRHEAVHALRDMGLFTPQEWRALNAQSSKSWMKEFDVMDRWGKLGLTPEALREEGIAEAFGSFKAGTLNAQQPIQKIMRKIAEFFTRLGNLLRGMGFQTVDDIFTKVESGEVGRRLPGTEFESPDGIKYAVGPNIPNAPPQQVQQNYVVSAQRALRQAATNPPANTWEADAGLLKRLLVTPRTIAAFDQDFVPVYQTAVEQWKFRDQLIAKFERASEPYFKASQADQKIVNQILEHDRLTGQVGLAGQNMTVHFTSPEAVLSKPGERLTVTDDQKRAYWAVRSMLNEALNEFRDQTLEDFNLPRGTTAAQVTAQAAQATVKAEAQRLVKIAEILQGIEDSRRTGYVPFSRYGEVGIAVRNPLTGTLAHYETVEVGMLGKKNGRALTEIPEVKARLAELRKKYPGQTIAEPFQVPKAGMPPQVKLEEVDALAEMAKIDNATWDSVRAKLEQAVAGQGFRAHFFRSKNIPGYSPDFERGLANYVNGISGYLARRRYASKWVAAIAPISMNKPKLRQYAQEYQKYVNSPAEEFGFLRSVNFVYYLTSVATWITNLTQVPFVSMPWTTQFANPVAIGAAYTRASAEAAAMLTVKNGTQLYSASKAPADVRAAVQQAYDQGLFIPITTYESMGIARNQGRRLRNVSKGAQTAIELFGLGFTMAERQNRISTFIALYRLARDNPAVKTNFERVMADNAMGRDLMTHWSPEAFAEFGIDETHFKSGKVNRQALGRNAGTLVFQFKMFNLNVLERLVTMAALQGSEGRAAAALILMTLGTMAGIWGLPGADNLKDLYELFMKKVKNRDVNADAEMRKIIVELTGSATAAQAVSGGVTRALPEPWNIDLSQRVGMGKILPNEAGAMAGVSYDLWFKRPMQAMEQFEVDNYLLGMAELMPKQAADIMTQLAWSKAGVRSKASDLPLIPPEKVTPEMRLQKAVGFTPGTVANVREAERAEQIAKSAANEARTDFYRRMAKVVAEEVRAEAAKDVVAEAKAAMAEEVIWADVEKWNKANPEDYLQVRLDRKTARTNLVKEFEGADYDKGARKQARGEIGRLREIYGR